MPATQKIKNVSREEMWEMFEKLPSSVQDIIYSPETSELNGKLREKFKLDENQFQKFLDIVLLTYARKISLSDFVDVLKNELGLKDEEVKEMTLELAQKHFWPMSHFLGGVERLINSLGGEIPKEEPKPIIDEKEIVTPDTNNNETNFYSPKNNTRQDNIIEKPLKMALEENSTTEEQLITSENINMSNNAETRNPSIKYWLKEYIQTLGAGYHPNLDRIGFLYNNLNAKRLSNEERLVLGAVLKSYDDGDSLPFSETTGRLMVEKLKE